MTVMNALARQKCDERVLGFGSGIAGVKKGNEEKWIMIKGQERKKGASVCCPMLDSDRHEDSLTEPCFDLFIYNLPGFPRMHALPPFTLGHAQNELPSSTSF